MGLYTGGLIIGRIFESEISGAYSREGVFFSFCRGGGLTCITRILLFVITLCYNILLKEFSGVCVTCSLHAKLCTLNDFLMKVKCAQMFHSA